MLSERGERIKEHSWDENFVVREIKVVEEGRIIRRNQDLFDFVIVHQNGGKQDDFEFG